MRQHECERVFSAAARTCNDQRVRQASSRDRRTQILDDGGVAEEFGEAGREGHGFRVSQLPGGSRVLRSRAAVAPRDPLEAQRIAIGAVDGVVQVHRSGVLAQGFGRLMIRGVESDQASWGQEVRARGPRPGGLR